MVVIVSDAAFIASNRPGGLDAADEPDLGEGVERVIHSLVRNRRQRLTHGADDGIGVRMRVISHGIKYRNSLLRHAQSCLPQCGGRRIDLFLIRPLHTTRMPTSFERVKERKWPCAGVKGAPG